MPRSVMVVHAGLSGAFYKTVPRIPSRGTYNHQGMPYLATHPKETLRAEYGQVIAVSVFFFFVYAQTYVCLVSARSDGPVLCGS